MVVMGLALMGLFPRWAKAVPGDDGVFASLVRPLFGVPTRLGALVLGIATGFLPCPVVLGFLALSAGSGSVPVGMAIMAAAGLGTVWSLLVLGILGDFVGARLRRWGVVAAGIVLILLGLVTALRATPAFHHLLGCPQVGANAPADCCHGGH